MPDITGAAGTGNIAASLLLPDTARTVLELEPSVTPLTVLTMAMRTNATHNPEFSWHEDKLEPRFDTTTQSRLITDLTITVTNISYYAQHDLVKVPRTGEVMYIAGVTAATSTITVERGIGGGAAAINNAEELLIIGSARPEGDMAKPARSSNPVKILNYTEIVSRSYHSTKTARATNTWTSPSDWTRRKAHASMEWKKDRELISWFGRPSIVNTGAHPRRTSGGVTYFVVTNRTDMGGLMTESEFFGSFSGAFRYGNQGTKTMFASRLVVDVVNGYPRGKIQVVNADKDTHYGLNVVRFISPHGTVNIVTHNLFEGATYGGQYHILDMSQIERRVLKNDEEDRELRDYDDIQQKGEDARKGEWLEESGLQFGLEKAHATGYNITS